MTINPYLIFGGNCEEAFNLYKKVFGVDFSMVSRYKDAPPSPDMKMSDSEKEKIMHIALPISKETILMGSDSPQSMGEIVSGNNFNISINPDSEKETTRIFNLLADGGKINMPLEKTFWNAYYGMCTDKFGVKWMVNFELKK